LWIILLTFIPPFTYIMPTFSHTPVLLEKAVNALNIKSDGVYLDGTFGGGGHSKAILERLSERGRLFAIDRDLDAIAASTIDDERVTLVHGNFAELLESGGGQLPEKFDGMLFDIGVSSYQLDERSRGFSFKDTAPLDMRMDRSATLTAREIVNEWSYEELKRIFYEYGEERYAPQIAGRICDYREQTPIETTEELVSLLKSHPKRVFQALRIAVNDELGNLERMLRAAPTRLNEGGRLAVISFHSLEDRLVKHSFRDSETLRVITKHPLKPSDEERAENTRARSASLRVAQLPINIKYI
jgi:16S rRNA (cytosine1402-N4)-methyltransferase